MKSPIRFKTAWFDCNTIFVVCLQLGSRRWAWKIPWAKPRWLGR